MENIAAIHLSRFCLASMGLAAEHGSALDFSQELEHVVYMLQE